MPAIWCQAFWGIQEEATVRVISAICIALALAIPLTFSITSASTLLSSRRENSSPSEKTHRRFLILHWHLLLLTTLAYTLPIIVDLVSHVGFYIHDDSTESTSSTGRKAVVDTATIMYASVAGTFTCRNLTANWWSPPGFTHIFWLVNLLTTDAALLYLANRSRGIISKYIIYPLCALFVIGLLPIDNLRQFFLILLELFCVSILLLRLGMDTLAARKGKSPAYLQTTLPVSYKLAFVGLVYAVIRTVYIPVLITLGGADIWADPLVFVGASIFQHVYIIDAVENSDLATGFVALSQDPDVQAPPPLIDHHEAESSV